MRLVHKSTGKEVAIGDRIVQHGETMYVTGWKKPTSPASQGHIHVSQYEGLDADKRMTLGQSFYASVYDCEWIEREDRAEMDAYPLGSMQNPRIVTRTEAKEMTEQFQRGEIGESQDEQMRRRVKEAHDAGDDDRANRLTTFYD